MARPRKLLGLETRFLNEAANYIEKHRDELQARYKNEIQKSIDEDKVEDIDSYSNWIMVFVTKELPKLI